MFKGNHNFSWHKCCLGAHLKFCKGGIAPLPPPYATRLIGPVKVLPKFADLDGSYGL